MPTDQVRRNRAGGSSIPPSSTKICRICPAQDICGLDVQGPEGGKGRRGMSARRSAEPDGSTCGTPNGGRAVLFSAKRLAALMTRPVP